MASGCLSQILDCGRHCGLQVERSGCLTVGRESQDAGFRSSACLTTDCCCCQCCGNDRRDFRTSWRRFRNRHQAGSCCCRVIDRRSVEDSRYRESSGLVALPTVSAASARSVRDLRCPGHGYRSCDHDRLTLAVRMRRIPSHGHGCLRFAHDQSAVERSLDSIPWFGVAMIRRPAGSDGHLGHHRTSLGTATCRVPPVSAMTGRGVC